VPWPLCQQARGATKHTLVHAGHNETRCCRLGCRQQRRRPGPTTPPPSCSKRISPRCVPAHILRSPARHQRPVKRVMARASAGSLPPHHATWRPVPPISDGKASKSCPRFFSGFTDLPGLAPAAISV